MMKGAVSLGVQVVLVIAAVVVFSYFDPFGLLSPKKKTLEDTPITVTSIREIGQLVTAEYYGEVLSSLQDSLIEEVKANNNEAVKEFARLHTLYIKALQDFYVSKESINVHWYSKRKDLADYFYDVNTAITNNIYYQDMIELVLKNSTNKNKYNGEGDMLLDLSREKTLPTDLATRYKADTVKFKEKRANELKELTSKRSFKKRQIIVLGRGWVRAGIDFGKFTDRNFKYDRAHKTVYLLGIKPTILDCDINPWFIPEQKVKGFEIIAATNKANDPEYLVKVKTNCLNKLYAQAVNNGIIAQAKVNAEESLKNFLSLLLDEPIDQVRIMENPMEIYDESFPEDKVIPKERLAMLDSMLLSISKMSVESAYDRVKKLPRIQWDSTLKTLPVRRYTALSHRLAEDKLLSASEWEQLTEAFTKTTFTKLDSLWLFSPEKYLTLARDAKDSMPETLKSRYASGTRFWIDSVTNNENYLKWTKALKSFRSNAMSKDMMARRDTARWAAIDFLKKTVKTIRLKDNVVINDTLNKVQIQLDALNPQAKAEGN